MLQSKREYSVVDMLRQRSASPTRNKTAFTFLRDNGYKSSTITYAELDRKAQRIATVLQEMGAQKQRALLIYPPGISYICGFLGCLYAGVIVVPSYPPTSQRAATRLAGVIENCEASIILANTEVISAIKKLQMVRRLQKIPGLAKLSDAILSRYGINTLPDWGDVLWVDTDKAVCEQSASWHPPTASLDETAFIQYTSGSTGDPKGVMVSHANIIENSCLIQDFSRSSSETIGMSWLPPYHDMGLIGFILHPIHIGCHVYLYSPVEFLNKPHRWLELISEKRVTHTGGPNFAYDLCVKHADKVAPDTDLSCWQIAFNGAEPIRSKTLHDFCQSFRSYHFSPSAMFPCYGMAETTLIISGKNYDGDSFGENDQPISCGPFPENHEVVIVDSAANNICPEGQTGEIWICGPCVARGYWQNPTATENTFAGFLTDGRGPYLRTGDLGFLKRGELFVTGRSKDLIIIRGQNYYPQDIEHSVSDSSSALRRGCGAVFSVTIEGEEKLVVVQEIRDTEDDLQKVVRQIRQAVATDYLLHCFDVVLIKPRTIAKTTSGKIQRYACRQDYLAGNLQIVMNDRQSEPLEEAAPLEIPEPFASLTCHDLQQLSVEQRIETLLGYLKAHIAVFLCVDTDRVDSSQTIDKIGLDSLQMVEMKLKLDEIIGCEFNLDRFCANPTLQELAQIAVEIMEEDNQATTTGNDPAPATQGQSRQMLVRFVKDPFAFMMDLHDEQGETASFYLGSRSIFSFTNPEDVHEVLAKSSEDFCKGEIYQVLGRLMGKGMVTSDTNEVWKQQRQAANPLFTRNSILESTPAIVAITEKYTKQWKESSSASKVDVDILSIARKISLQIVVDESLRLQRFERFEELYQFVVEIEDGIDIPSTFYVLEEKLDQEYQENSRFLRSIEKLDELIYEIIDDYLAHGGESDTFLSLLSQVEFLQKQPLDIVRRCFRDAIVSMIFAGMGTTSSGLLWTLYLLDRHPQCQEAVEKELAEAIPTAVPDRDIMAKCPQLMAVIYESLRLYPPIWWIDRQAVRDTCVGKDDVPQGADIFISAYAIQRNPAVWSDPTAFRPERFAANVKNPFRNKGFLPFGTGKRICIGAQFSLHEMAVILSLWLSCYRFAVTNDEEVELGTTLSLVPRKKMLFTVREY